MISDGEMLQDIAKKVWDKSSWRSCIVCGGSIVRIREAFFKCKDCGQEIISCEEDMWVVK